MNTTRRPYPSDVSDEEWSLVAPYLTLQREDAGQREHGLREVFNGLRYIVKTGAPWRWMPNDRGCQISCVSDAGPILERKGRDDDARDQGGVIGRVAVRAF